MTFAGFFGLEQRRDHPQGQVEGTASKVAYEIQRRSRGLIVPADAVQRAGQSDVVEIMSGGLRQGTFLSPAGDAAINEARVAPRAVVGPKAQSLGDAGPEAFDQGIGLFDKPQHQPRAFRVFEIHGHRTPGATQEIELARHADPQARGLDAVDGQHVSPQFGQQHAAHRTWSYAGQFDHFVTVKRSHGIGSLSVRATRLIGELSNLHIA